MYKLKYRKIKNKYFGKGIQYCFPDIMSTHETNSNQKIYLQNPKVIELHRHPKLRYQAFFLNNSYMHAFGTYFTYDKEYYRVLCTNDWQDLLRPLKDFNARWNILFAMLSTFHYDFNKYRYNCKNCGCVYTSNFCDGCRYEIMIDNKKMYADNIDFSKVESRKFSNKDFCWHLTLKKEKQ